MVQTVGVLVVRKDLIEIESMKDKDDVEQKENKQGLHPYPITELTS